VGEALSVTVIVAEKVAAEAGANAAVMVQLALAASEAPQVELSVKSAALVPPRTMPLMVNAAFPVLVSVAVCVAEVWPTVVLAKVSAVAESEAAGAVGLQVIPQLAVPPPLLVPLPHPARTKTIVLASREAKRIAMRERGERIMDSLWREIEIGTAKVPGLMQSADRSLLRANALDPMGETGFRVTCRGQEMAF
jgi:hypothetical protein